MGERMEKEKRKEALRAAKFVLFSASAGLIEAGVFALLNELTAWKYWPCYLIALTASVVWNFTLNRKFTFQSANKYPRQCCSWRSFTAYSRRFRRSSAII